MWANGAAWVNMGAQQNTCDAPLPSSFPLPLHPSTYLPIHVLTYPSHYCTSYTRSVPCIPLRTSLTAFTSSPSSLPRLCQFLHVYPENKVPGAAWEHAETPGDTSPFICLPVYSTLCLLLKTKPKPTNILPNRLFIKSFCKILADIPGPAFYFPSPQLALKASWQVVSFQ